MPHMHGVRGFVAQGAPIRQALSEVGSLIGQKTDRHRSQAIHTSGLPVFNLEQIWQAALRKTGLVFMPTYQKSDMTMQILKLIHEHAVTGRIALLCWTKTFFLGPQFEIPPPRAEIIRFCRIHICR